jgi:hypothetical protein
LRARPLLLVLAGAAVLIVLFVVLRPDDDDSESRPTPPPATQTQTETETETGTETEPPPPPPPPAVEIIRIQIRGGNVLGERPRPRIDRGERVRLIVGADITDHVHLHGYDIMRDVSPGHPAVIRFRATTPGRFEVELEDRSLQIAVIEVRP